MTAFAQLLAQPGVVERVARRGRVGFMALEVMTDVIAERAAEDAGASCYSVIQPIGMSQHLSSIEVRPEESEALADFVEHVDVVVTIHGFGRRGMFGSLLLGGQNRELADHVGATLREHLPAYEIVTELDTIPRPLRGLHDRNPVNLPSGKGVQIELPPRVRGSSPLWWDWEGPGLTPHTEALIAGLVSAAREWVDGTARDC